MAEENPNLLAPIEKQFVSEQDVGKQIQDRLKKVDGLEGAIEDLRDKLDEANERAGRLLQEKNNFESLADRKETLDAREAELNAREAKFDMEAELNDTKLMLAAEKKRVEDHQKMMELIFRNSRLRKEGVVPLTRNLGGTSYNSGYSDKGDIPLEGMEEISLEHTSETEEEI